MALADAVEAGRIAYSPVERIPRRQRPKHQAEKRADKYWSPDEARTFLDATRDDRIWPLWALALTPASAVASCQRCAGTRSTSTTR